MKLLPLVLVCLFGLGWKALGASPIGSPNAAQRDRGGVPNGPPHWSFIPPQRPPEPSVRQKTWPRTPIDRFILARLEKENIRPSPEAERATLIRRLSLDLAGLPPSPEQVEAFVNDPRPDAYEHWVERLLASPHYGERWGRHWLDLARYADSNGYSIDAPRSIWKYRDWIIDALNRDLPFDQFAIEQLAGDLLPNATREQKVATGFHRNTPINEEGGIDKEQFRIESVIDRVNTTATVFLGLTLGCAQCHDHKYDPLSQKEYFQFFAFLNNTDEPNLEVASADELERRDTLRQQTQAFENELSRYVDSRASELTEWELALAPETRAKMKPDLAGILELASDKRSGEQKRKLYEAFRKDDPEYKQLRNKISELERKAPRFLTTMVMAERGEPRESYLFIKGDFTRKGEAMTPGVPKVLHLLAGRGKLNRLALANWIADPRNPLTARVTVNRIWQQYFGRGLVETENDFGTQGSPPTHPALLDWLATELLAQNWSLKAIHRLMVSSSVYRQSSRVRPDLAVIDPNNQRLARQARLRLDAEVIRDVALAASGRLTERIGGPGVFPPQPEGVLALGQSRREWKPSEGADRYRRGMYTFFWRATPHPALLVFDAPDGTSACTRRLRSNTPLQALTLLNDQGYFELAQGLAARVLKAGQGSDDQRIDYAFRLCLARAPSSSEKERLVELLAQQLARRDSGVEAAKAPDEPQDPSMWPAKQLAAWTTVSRVLLNLDETITRE